jgi:hypothetical protein
MNARIRAALASQNPSKRLFDFFYANPLFALPNQFRRKIIPGQDSSCPPSYQETWLALHRRDEWDMAMLM